MSRVALGFGRQLTNPKFACFDTSHTSLKRAKQLGRFTRLLRCSKLGLSSSSSTPTQNVKIVCPDYLEASDSNTEQILAEDFLLHKDFLTEIEEQHLLQEVVPYLARLKYEYAHWDNAIHGYRETERKHWTATNKVILERVKQYAFPPTVSALAFVHILDLAEDGYIKPHIDAVRFCGNTIAGLSLLSPCVMRLVHDKDKEKYGNVLLQPRSLYIMRNRARYEYTHEVLPGDNSVFKGQNVPKMRRISVICRNEPE